MNERIKELAEQAYKSCFDDTYCPNYTTDRLYEKFAELIVRECMYIGRLAQINNQLVDSEIKEHFGVE